MRVEAGGEELELLAGRALWWPRGSTLFLADMHLGKAATFRSLGIPVPEATTPADIARLGAMIDRFNPARVVILGDLLHAAAGRCSEVVSAFERWRERCDIPMLLVRGNHDAHAGDPPPEWRIECVDAPIARGPFVLAHEPCEDPRGLVLCGHLHPAARLVGRSDSMRVACFWLRRCSLVLPAFGSFTGMRVVRPAPGDRVFAAGSEVIEVGTLIPR